MVRIAILGLSVHAATFQRMLTKTGLGRVSAAGAALAIAATAIPLAHAGASEIATNDGDLGARATVVRVVDGDTVDVQTAPGATTRIRILNINTPETVDPRRPAECLGEEASEFTHSLLPEGTPITLEYDHERTDRFGRTLATIRLSDNRSVANELARAGLGTPMSVGLNDAALGGVIDAIRDARQHDRGFYDPANNCPPPSQAAGLLAEVTAAWQPQTFTTASSAEAAINGLGAATAGVNAWTATSFATRLAITAASRGTDWLGTLTHTGAEAAVAAVILNHAWQAHGNFVQQRDDLRAAEAAQAERERLAEEARAAAKAAEEEARAKAAAEARMRVAPPKPKPRVAPAPKPPAKPAPRTTPAPKPKAGGGSSGYTGPRCYAPGGKTWRPC